MSAYERMMGLPPGWQAAQQALQHRQMTHDPFTLPQSVSATRDYLGRVVAGDVFMDSLRHYDNLMARSVGIDPVTMQRTEPDPAAAMELGMEFLPGPMIPGMTVFHGSPHKFTKFDLSKVGTGEGAQAYGHGLYFAESPGVAGEYARKLSPPQVTMGGKDVKEVVKNVSTDDAAGLEAIRGQLYSTQADNRTALLHEMRRRPWVQQLESKYGVLDIKDTSHLYEVDIPDDAIARMLDWDAPLSEQPESVRKVLDLYIQDGWVPNSSVTDAMGTSSYKTAQNMTGAELLDAMEQQGKRVRMDRAAISDMLRADGIPGIKYFDGSSRAAGEGTRNIVLFDDSLAKVLKINDEVLK